MGNRAESSGISITEEDAALIRGMILRGDRKHDIAAFFGVNPGRIADVESGRRFPSVPAAPKADLPPPGPYLAPKAVWRAGAAEFRRPACDENRDSTTAR
jgi:hypothetical protein